MSVSASVQAQLDELFEPCAALHGLLAPHASTLNSTLSHAPPAAAAAATTPSPDSTTPALVTESTIDLVSDILMTGLGSRDVDTILNAHPRLGAPPSTQSSASKAEQNQLQGGQTDEITRLAALNELYEETFPGLRYVVFVDGRSREVVMQDMNRRIERRDLHAERVEGVRAMCDIARDRLSKKMKTR